MKPEESRFYALFFLGFLTELLKMFLVLFSLLNLVKDMWRKILFNTENVEKMWSKFDNVTLALEK